MSAFKVELSFNELESGFLDTADLHRAPDQTQPRRRRLDGRTAPAAVLKPIYGAATGARKKTLDFFERGPWGQEYRPSWPHGSAA